MRTLLPGSSLRCRARRGSRGFTMIELVVVMAILGLLLSIAVPRFMDSLERGREHVLEHNLAQIRQAIDRYYGDRGAYPDRLEDLVQRRYLRAVPVNPFSAAADWEVIGPPSGQPGSVYDVAEPAEARAARLHAAEAAGPSESSADAQGTAE